MPALANVRIVSSSEVKTGGEITQSVCFCITGLGISVLGGRTVSSSVIADSRKAIKASTRFVVRSS